VALVVLGAVMYVVSLLPINGTIKQIIYVVGILFALGFVLDYFAWYSVPFFHRMR
jgi:hypothetical protein